MIYLDWAASAPPGTAALDEAHAVALRWFANPSAPHAAGREAGDRLETARSRVAGLLEVPPRSLFFTSGGTESNTSLLLSLLSLSSTSTSLSFSFFQFSFSTILSPL